MMITLLGEPKSNQKIYKIRSTGRFATMYMSSEGKSIKGSYSNQARLKWHSVPLQGDVEIYVKLYFGTKRKCDIDNFGKLLLDSLTGICWHDDSQIQKMTVEKHFCKEKPRIEIDVITM
jgi:Holliday junction resolvase RusA-like endonuclease